jgi:hypothetical protein
MHLDSVKAMLGYGSEKRQIEILIGNFMEPLTKILSEMIKGTLKDKYDLRFRSASYGEDLLESAASHIVDMFILVLNNIMFHAPLDPNQDRMELSLQLLNQLKTTYEKPIIALSGWLEDTSFIERAKLSADFFFPLPLKKDGFGDAIKKCLNILSD